VRDQADGLHPVLALPAFILAMVLSAPIYRWIDQHVGGSRDSAAMLLPYLCCAFLPAAAVTFGAAMAIQSAFERAGERAVETALGVERPPSPPFVLPRPGPVPLMILASVAALACIAFASLPKRRLAAPAAPPVVTGDPAADRALALARRAVVERLSEAGIAHATFTVRRTSVAGRPCWRVAVQGAVTDYVVDVGDGPSPAVTVHAPGGAPPEDV
jgi:hypothetical protein